MFKKASYALRGYKLYSRFWDWWQTVKKAWRERNNMPTVGEVKTAWQSKINWLAFGNILISLLDMIGKTLTAEDQAQIMSLFSGDMASNWFSIGVSVAIVVIRSYFTTKLTKGSVK